MRWAGHVANMGEMNSYRILVGKPERKRPLQRRRRDENIKMNLKELGYGMGSSGTGQRPVAFLANTVG
jgi:hypothetical protein